jgi:hypothetical protein
MRFKEYLIEATFGYGETKYLDSFIKRIEQGEKLRLGKDGTGGSVVIKYDDQVKLLKQNYEIDRNLIKNIKFTDTKGNVYRFTQFFKGDFSGFSGNRNALGDNLTKAGENATLLSLTKKIVTPEDTNEKIFINDPSAFNDWKFTFDNTKIAIESIIEGSIKDYKIIHFDYDKDKLLTIITQFLKKYGISKDVWNAGDVILISKSNYNSVIKKLDYIASNHTGERLISFFNSEIYNMYKSGDLYFFSLKQLKNSVRKDPQNEPGKEIHYYPFKINKFITDMRLGAKESKEIGAFIFKNLETKGFLRMQIRPFPYGFSTTQVEITDDGSASGGRIGKVSSEIVDLILKDYNFSRISKANYFGSKSKGITNLDSKKKKEIITQYNYVISQRNVESKDVDIKDIVENIESRPYDEQVQFMVKVQGLRFQYFFLKNKKNITNILNELLLGAKKITKKSSFFYKIY